jgi:Holliday junction resolvase RusA-like endonuclease
MATYIVHHEPVGQPRHRISTRGGFAKMYLPGRHPVHAFKKAIRLAVGKPVKIKGPIEVHVEAWFSRPKSRVWKTKPMPAEWHTKKPDADNVLKAVLDALNGVAWVDDAQIVYASVTKYTCGGKSKSHVCVTIEECVQCH